MSSTNIKKLVDSIKLYVDDHVKDIESFQNQCITQDQVSKVTFTGNYEDLNNKPDIPSLDGYATESFVNENIKDFIKSIDVKYDSSNGDISIINCNINKEDLNNIKRIFNQKIEDTDIRDEVYKYEKSNDKQIIDILNIIDPLVIDIKTSYTILEIGKNLPVKVDWTYNQPIVSQIINDQILPLDTRTKTYQSVTQNTVFQITAVSKNGLKVRTAKGVYFYNGIYYGKSKITNPDEIDNDFILSLDERILTDTKPLVFKINAHAEEYIYFCAPARFNEYKFSINNFEGGYEKVKSIIFRNKSGYSEYYNIYRFVHPNLGITTVNAY